MKAKLEVPKDILIIIDKLRSEHFEALLVGGCVRDFLIGRAPRDWDLATNAKTDDLLRLFPDSLSLGVAFGVIAVKSTKLGLIEIATFREDGDYLDGRRPELIRYSDAKADARRRDFTINALFYDPYATPPIIDYVNGFEDIQNKIIRCVGKARERFTEDKLRILRAARFAFTLNFAIDSEILEAGQALASEIRMVSKERITDELRKMFKAVSEENPISKAIELLQKMALVDPLFGQKTFFSNAIPPNEVLLWLHSYEQLGESIKTRFMLSHDESHTLKSTLELSTTLKSWKQLREGLLLEAVSQKETLMALDYLSWKKQISSDDIKKLQDLSLQTTQNKTFQTLLINGAELIEMGFKPGPKLGNILREIRLQQLEKKIQNKEEAKALAKKID